MNPAAHESNPLAELIQNGLIENAFGTRDFVQYWSAWEVMRTGGNPYDQASLAMVQAQIIPGLSNGQAVMYWSPPWFLPLWSPILNLPFELAATVWLAASLAIALALFCFGIRWMQSPTIPKVILATGTVLIFSPLLDCLSWGQSSLWVALGMTLVAWFSSQGSFFKVGLCLPLLTLKPHLFLVAACGFLTYRLICGLFSSSRVSTSSLLPAWKNPIVRLGAGSILSGSYCLAILALYPAAASGWLVSISPATDTLATELPRHQWVTMTVASLLRSLVASRSEDASWAFISSLATGSCFFAYLWYRFKPSLVSLTNAPAILVALSIVSLIFAPYGWHYDLVILLPFLIATIGSVSALQATLVILPVCLGRVMLAYSPSQYSLLVIPTLLLIGTLAIALKNRPA